MSSEVGLFWLMLPLVAGVTWFFAHRPNKTNVTEADQQLRRSYFRGLNYLLEEQPDKAIEVFLKIAELDRDTIETHFALANLFRKRGEVDRAIRIHQNLIARPNLTPDQKSAALLELGADYMRAGLLDRAETLFADLLTVEKRAPAALKQLITIYQQERDWQKAIDHAERLAKFSGQSLGPQIAQYCCELAEVAHRRADDVAAHKHLEAAFRNQPHCVRAHILTGTLAAARGEHERAIAAFERATEQDVECVPEVVPKVIASFEASHKLGEARGFLERMMQRYPGISPVLAMTRVLEREESEETATRYLSEHLRTRPSVRGLTKLIELTLMRSEGAAHDDLLSLRELVRRLMEGQAIYRCEKCGFGAKTHFWQCPGCKSWSSIKPVHGVAGD